MIEPLSRNRQYEFMRAAIKLAADNLENGSGGPFGAVIVRRGEIIAAGNNQVTSSNDPTAHAEIVAIRRACELLKTFSLTGCEMFASCEPCPMCLAALYWAGIEKITYAADRHDAAVVGFADEHIYAEINKNISQRAIKTLQLGREEALRVFAEWDNSVDKITY